MTNTRFNKLWERCERNGMVIFAEHGEQYTLSVHRYMTWCIGAKRGSSVCLLFKPKRSNDRLSGIVSRH